MARRYARTASTRRWSSSLTVRPSFIRIARTCVSTVFSVSHSRLAMPELVRPSAISGRTSCSREGGPAVGDAARRIEEVVDVEHAVLEQVAEAAAVGDQLDDVARLDVLGEH